MHIPCLSQKALFSFYDRIVKNMMITLATGEQIPYAPGESLLQSLKRQGVYLTASCGGKGICGKCRLKIVEGKTRTESIGKLDPGDVKKGIVLACQTFPEEDIRIEIPKESRLVVGDAIEISRSGDLHELFQSLNCSISPLLQKISLDIEPPSLRNNISDFERFRKALEEKPSKNIYFPHNFFSGFANALRQSEWKIDFHYSEDGRAAFITPSKSASQLGIAVDIGTTTVVLYLVNIDTGSLVDVSSTYNSQIRFGDDVITRIIYATEGGGLSELRDAIVDDINNLITPLIEKHSLSSEQIHSAVLSGNTIMMHLLWGLNPEHLREEPYTPTLNAFPIWDAKTARFHANPRAPVYTVPCVASYIGGDIVAGVLASDMHRHRAVSLFMDIGTNGEIVIGNNEWLITAACSAGPCFEGSGIKHGMRATKGAVQALSIHPQTHETSFKIIGDVNPVGICGSGMIDALTELFLTGLIDQKGKFRKYPKSERIQEGFNGFEFLLYKDNQREIVLTEVDIENILRAKAALYAGISSLIKEVGLAINDLDRIYIAGGFGNYLNVKKAITIGMLPDLPKEKFTFLGNTSIAGAYLCLRSGTLRKEAEDIALKMTNIELSVSRNFMDEYMSALFLPHTDMGLFPTVAKLLKQRRQGNHSGRQ